MKVSLKKAFSILDGRLSTEMGDVYLMLNYIFDEKFPTLEIELGKLKSDIPFSAGLESFKHL